MKWAQVWIGIHKEDFCSFVVQITQMVHLLNDSEANKCAFMSRNEWLMQCKKLKQKQEINRRGKKEMKRGALMPEMLFELFKNWSRVSANSKESYRWFVIFRINAVPVFRGNWLPYYIAVTDITLTPFTCWQDRQHLSQKTKVHLSKWNSTSPCLV